MEVNVPICLFYTEVTEYELAAKINICPDSRMVKDYRIFDHFLYFYALRKKLCRSTSQIASCAFFLKALIFPQ